MSAPIDYSIVGKRVGIFEVLRYSHSKHGQTYWLCRCDCGTEFLSQRSAIVCRPRKSCGCLMREHQRTFLRKHGLSDRTEHYIWLNIIARCEDSNQPAYPRYGGRGITICARWRADFTAFLADMGDRPSLRHSVDRRDNDGNYEPSNCYWAVPSQQSRNQRTNVWLTLNGRRQISADWASEIGMSRATLCRRRQAGWTDEQVLLTPKGARTPINAQHREAA